MKVGGLCFLLLLAVPALAQAPSKDPDTPKPPPDRQSFSFVVFGDRTGGKPQGVRVLERAVDAANRLDPDFVMTVGDLVNGYNTGKKWLEQAKEFKGIMSRLERPWYPVAGNHDVYGNRANPTGNVDLYKKHFGPLKYGFDYKWAHFIVLFSDEMLAFRNPAKTQNMSAEQRAWLERDLQSTKAKQIYVFLHHPRWLYRGTNWPKVHEILKKDGRVKAVFGGHIHTYRDDGEKDGIHYYTLAVTGGYSGGFKTPASLHHMNHVRVTPTGFRMSVFPIGSVVGSNLAYGSEINELGAMRGGGWLAVDGAVEWSAKERKTSQIVARVTNPAKKPAAYELRPGLPRGWKATPSFLGGILAPGKSTEVRFEVETAPFSGRPAKALLHATMHYALRSGLVQPVHHSRTLSVRVGGVETAAGRTNRVLVLDGKSAVRIDTGEIGTSAFTLECWVKGPAPQGSRALVAKTEQSGFGLWWCSGGRKLPYGVVGFQQRAGYQHVDAPKPWAFNQWTHLAMTNGDGFLRLWVNGKKAAEQKLPGLRNHNRHPLYIGADPDRRGKASRHFVGSIDEVRFSTRVRYHKRFTPAKVFKRDKHTYLLLHFDRTEGVLHPDDSGGQRHGWSVGKPKIEPR